MSEQSTKYRGQQDIIHLLLKTCHESSSKTNMMYSARLSYTQIKAYLSLLLDKQLISESPGTKSARNDTPIKTTYRTTELGEELREYLDKVIAILK